MKRIYVKKNGDEVWVDADEELLERGSGGQWSHLIGGSWMSDTGNDDYDAERKLALMNTIKIMEESCAEST